MAIIDSVEELFWLFPFIEHFYHSNVC